MLKMEKPNVDNYGVWDYCFSQPPKEEKLGSQLPKKFWNVFKTNNCFFFQKISGITFMSNISKIKKTSVDLVRNSDLQKMFALNDNIIDKDIFLTGECHHLHN